MDSVIAACGVIGTLTAGAHMVLRPATYLGKGTPPASDPRTVRAFGIFFIGLATVGVVFALIKFVSE
ncbi:hypothetical protein SAMN03159338_3022 [Sphingomonas sp. NFR04]|nr:hypothetical protein SAMN03159338_3022 [Sphingomonas sp. NFR04]